MSRPKWEDRDPVFRPSSMSERSIQKSERRRWIAKCRSMALVAAAVVATMTVAWHYLHRYALLGVVVASVGCASPAADYVHAEAAAWAQIDGKLDGWIDSEPSFSPEKRDALHQLNDARRARVAHAIAAVGS